MIRLILLIIVILFFLWLISNLFLKDKKELDKKLKISKPLLLLGIVAGIVLFAFILPRFGLNTLFLIQKIAPFLSFLRGFIPF